jgi:hypothetical protein
MRRVRAIQFLVGVVAMGGVASSSPVSAAGGAARATACAPLPIYGPGASYHPQIDPANFTPNVTNPFFALTPGTTQVNTGTKDGKKALDIFAPSSRTAVIDGVTTRIVEDRLFLNNVLEERTSDYYSQDGCGNVWYFGEDTATLDSHGNVISTAGSFHAGIDRAQPGVYMQAKPDVGRRFRQEWYSGQAEDTFSVLSLATPVTVPYGSFQNALRTEETTALEPGVLDNKYYVQGIGQVEETSLMGPVEKLELTTVIN